jgi:Flp pilus assembly pilin Flp
MLKNINRLLKNKQGQSLVEYGILVGAIAVVCLGATALLGHKVNDLIAIATSLLPGAHDEDNGAIVSGELVQTSSNNGVISLTGTPGSVTANLGLSNPTALVVEPSSGGSGGSGS